MRDLCLSNGSNDTIASYKFAVLIRGYIQLSDDKDRLAIRQNPFCSLVAELKMALTMLQDTAEAVKKTGSKALIITSSA